MYSPLDFNDENFQRIFRKDLNIFQPYIKEIANSIVNDEFTIELRDAILAKYDVERSSDIKEESLDFLLYYINIILIDDILTDIELKNLKQLKRIFKLKEGDFYSLRKDKIQEILNRQLHKIYEDNVVNSTEALLNVGIQELFDLSYDQYQELSVTEIKKTVDRGAHLDDLDNTVNLR
ncbi:hypothetical protein QGN23_09405 [Chryseobacterium gotjawalense]|uniref:Uncharacterized protein n=1 Tax=Chryseobacterium gotjawalense TaxID=3042315 RepID=A0ABY8RAX0_9FLAO|nr:hypothetical protein [Chryseobacterium sp. wdc7]WHF50654.1 hypothetical protein QGN23_09405 [Chryseobacterium sp. wdc7]